jgi:type 1 glutamine amidotransferase
MLLFTRRMKLKGKQLERVKTYCLSGRPIVGVRTASHGIQTWLDLDKAVLGGNYHGHYGRGPKAVVRFERDALKHPILAGVKPFTSAGSLYKNTPIAKDAQLLMTGEIPEHREPVTWTRTYKGARIFYTSLGHPEDFKDPQFVRMLANALFWAAKREPP